MNITIASDIDADWNVITDIFNLNGINISYFDNKGKIERIAGTYFNAEWKTNEELAREVHDFILKLK